MDDPPVGQQPYTVHSAESGAKSRHAFPTDTAKSLDSNGGFAYGQGGTVVGPGEEGLTEDDPLAFNWQEDDQVANWRERDYSPPLTVKSDHYGAIAVKEAARAFAISSGAAREQDVSPTLTAAGEGPRRHAGAWSMTQLTALVEQYGPDIELAVRLELDGYLAPSPYDPQPDGPRYAAMGDAVTVNVIEWIGARLRAAL